MSDIDEAVRLARSLVSSPTHPLLRDLARAVLALHERCEKLTAVYEAAVAWRHTSITLQNPIEDSEVRRAAHRLANIDLCEAVDAARGAGTDGGKRP